MALWSIKTSLRYFNKKVSISNLLFDKKGSPKQEYIYWGPRGSVPCLTHIFENSREFCNSIVDRISITYIGQCT